MATKKTATPSGLTITRSKNKFTFSWSVKNAPTAQEVQVRRYVGKKWTPFVNVSGIAAGTRSTVVSVDWSHYYPAPGYRGMGSIQFRVRGKRDKKWSDWVYKRFTFDYSYTPTAKATFSDTYDTTTTFSWTTTTSLTNNRPFYDIEWQSCLQNGYNAKKIKATANWSTLTDYKSGTSTTASSSTTITEVSGNIATGSHTRWFRVRARGCFGHTGWVYASHIYAKPWRAALQSTQATETVAGTLLTQMKWTVDEGGGAYPIDNVTVQYAAAVPGNGLSFPTGTTPTDASIAVDCGQTGAASFEVDPGLDVDEVLFTRVNTIHDRNVTNGVWHIAAYGALAAPTNLSVSTNNTTFKATVAATNNSTVPDSFMVIKYCPTSNPEGLVLGIIGHNESSKVVQCPNWSTETAIAFKVYAVQGSYTTTSLGGGVTEYRINANMESDYVEDGGAVPVAPANVNVDTTDTQGTVQVRWDWSWTDADGAEVSWADHEDAWESTEAPNTFEVTNMQSSKLNVTNLQTGQTWYIRVRLFSESSDARTYGAYSDIKSIDLSSAPITPAMQLLPGIISLNGMTTATWSYISGDGTPQMYAQICEVTFNANGDPVYGRKIASTQTAQHIDIYPAQLGWLAGSVHYLSLQVKSASNIVSKNWSPPVPVTIADPMTCSITSTSLVATTVTEDGDTYTKYTLDQLPLTITVSGAGTSGTVNVAIERAADYFLERPDESKFVGYKGETIATAQRSGNGTVTIEQNELLGMFDDGAEYRIIATTSDELGQSATATLDFEVGWDHQALIPTAAITAIGDVMSITPAEPTGAISGDTCDIYRLSVDPPQLIVQGAEWGTQYIDPFPTIGDFGGYRVVFRSLYGDYITSNNILAWTDYGKDENVYFYTPKTIIDFGDDSVAVMLDMTLTSEWAKDFQETKYLGGSVQGDWNPAVSRTGSVNATTIRFLDAETIQALHRLAGHSGVCHVRMPDGSNFHADVQVSLNSDFGNSPKITDCSLTITRVDGDSLDGQTYAEWSAGGV